MTLDSRKKMFERIKALLNTEGRTEAEMITFLAKARELMATYEIDEADLKEFEREKATLYTTQLQDPYDIKRILAKRVGEFTRCIGFNYRGKGISFVGMESDVIFATWLLDTLQRFIMRALREYQKQRIAKGGFRASSNLTSASFVHGCVTRIEEKLKELTLPLPAQNKAMIEAELAKNGIALRKSSSKSNIHEPSAMAGHKAGDSARFDRPVSESGVKRLK